MSADIPPPTEAEQAAIHAEVHRMHDWSLPHDARYPEADPQGCPRGCPFRQAVEAGVAEILRGLSERESHE